MPLPRELRTERLLLRAWRPADANRLHPVLAANAAHLAGWTPTHATGPAPLAVLVERLATFEAQFVAGEAWRYGLFATAPSADAMAPLGEVSVFPRDAAARVSLATADRVEFGYWLRADRSGHGFATEAVRAALDAAATALPGFTVAEIRCDARNESSAAVAARLEFTLAATERSARRPDADGSTTSQLWTRRLPSGERAGA